MSSGACFCISLRSTSNRSRGRADEPITFVSMHKSPRSVNAMARGKSPIKKSEIARAAQGLLAAVAAAGVHGDIEVDLKTGVVKFHMTGESGTSLPALAEE